MELLHATQRRTVLQRGSLALAALLGSVATGGSPMGKSFKTGPFRGEGQAVAGLRSFRAFLKLAGIQGGSEDPAHPGEIEVLSYQWGVSQTGNSSCGGGEGGAVEVQPLNILKRADQSSPTLFLRCCNGAKIDEGVLKICHAGNTAQEYLVYRFTDTLISGYDPGGASGEDEVPTESVNFIFSEMEVEYVPQGKPGRPPGAPIRAGFAFCELRET